MSVDALDGKVDDDGYVDGDDGNVDDDEGNVDGDDGYVDDGDGNVNADDIKIMMFTDLRTGCPHLPLLAQPARCP